MAADELADCSRCISDRRAGNAERGCDLARSLGGLYGTVATARSGDDWGVRPRVVRFA